MTSKERLEQYIKEDTIYQEYLDKHSSYVSDFDKFCIQHCNDIKNILYQNEELKKQLSDRNERLTRLRNNAEKHARRELFLEEQQEEFIKYLKDEIKRLEEVQVTSLEEITGKDYLIKIKKEILSKYKEIIGDIEDESNL